MGGEGKKLWKTFELDPPWLGVFWCRLGLVYVLVGSICWC